MWLVLFVTQVFRYLTYTVGLSIQKFQTWFCWMFKHLVHEGSVDLIWVCKFCGVTLTAIGYYKVKDKFFVSHIIPKGWGQGLKYCRIWILAYCRYNLIWLRWYCCCWYDEQKCPIKDQYCRSGNKNLVPIPILRFQNMVWAQHYRSPREEDNRGNLFLLY